jgi:hypothetical protein
MFVCYVFGLSGSEFMVNTAKQIFGFHEIQKFILIRVIIVFQIRTLQLVVRGCVRRQNT